MLATCSPVHRTEGRPGEENAGRDCNLPDLPVYTSATIQVRLLPTPLKSIVFTCVDSMDCRHLYCASCLLEFWDKQETPSCFTCHQRCLYPPARDLVHGLVVLAHEDSENGFPTDSLDDDPFLFCRFFPRSDQTSPTHQNMGNGQDNVGGKQKEHDDSVEVVEVEDALMEEEEL